jgi:hypothetical protein
MGRRIRKLLYELSGQGSLVKEDEKLLDVPYLLKFFQEIIITDGEEKITGLTEFVGNLSPEDNYSLALLVGKKLTLHLEEDRCLEITVTSNSGKILKHGEIYSCDGS